MSDSIGSITSLVFQPVRQGPGDASMPVARGPADGSGSRAVPGNVVSTPTDGLEREFSEARQGLDPSESEGMEQVVESINAYLQSSKRALEFSVDDSSGRTVITVKDAEQDEVIRQIPPEAVVALIRHFQEQRGLDGTGVEEQA
ncbi:flagellar protein FlaG [Thioalkalivibrio sp. ALRh]|uniref:flagellar protein FlaG n=1 Tax=Thioalkalivibrio sp. ALRh TaxID=1266911 RepID=UPI001E635B7D|nr:flagellar protein FlaG [Thioalkalivibrio sp. ALRh]